MSMLVTPEAPNCAVSVAVGTDPTVQFAAVFQSVLTGVASHPGATETSVRVIGPASFQMKAGGLVLKNIWTVC
jgi:sarcosine oxidase gamma subunit